MKKVAIVSVLLTIAAVAAVTYQSTTPPGGTFLAPTVQPQASTRPGTPRSAAVAAPASRGLAPIGSAADNNTNVFPPAWSGFPNAVPVDENSNLLKSALNNAVKYALNDWWTTQKKYASQAGTAYSKTRPAGNTATNWNSYIDLAKDQFYGNGNVVNIREDIYRPPATQALAIVIALKSGAYDSSLTSISEQEAKSRALKLITSVAKQHWSNDGQYSYRWGNDWQTPLTAHAAGLAGWMMWDELTVADQNYLKAMVLQEANRLIGYNVPYYKDLSGFTNYPGDSKIEENSWNASILQLAIAMMPAHPNYRAWMSENVELLSSSLATPDDATQGYTLHGAPRKWWLNGSNALADHTVINHNRVHPDYMLPGGTLMNTMIPASLANQLVPQAAIINASNVYAALTDLKFTAGTVIPGTNATKPAPPSGYTASQVRPLDGLVENYIYRRNGNTPLADVYFPQGNDWGSSRKAQYILNDSIAGALGLDVSSSIKAPVWENLHTRGLLAMQTRPGQNGKTYLGSYFESTEDNFFSREESVSFNLARAYFMKFMAANNKIGFTNENVGIIVDNWDKDVIKDSAWSPVELSSRTVDDIFYGGGLGAGAPWFSGAVLGNHFVAPSGSSGKVTFSFRAPKSGVYKVYAWWPADKDNSTDVSFTVTSTAGRSVTRVNQRTRGGQWVQLASAGYSFNAGSTYTVEVAAGANGATRADAVMFLE